TDAMRVAHHLRHVAWFEVGRTEWLRAAGLPYSEMEAGGVAFPVIALEVRYLAPARYDDVLEIETRLADHSQARISFSYSIRRKKDGHLLATGLRKHAAVDEAFRPCRLPENLEAILEGPRRILTPEGPC
ncbi:MAG: acyl-CoA thioesterase, partial [Acidobacteriota bacterium]